MIRFLYNLLYPIGLLIFLPGQIAKLLRRGNFQHKFSQRLGIYDRDVRLRLSSQPCTWIHAVSVGEVAIALKVSAKLKELDPNFFGVLTTTTTTGFAFATKQAGERMEVLYSPLDFWPIMRRAYAAISPIRVILVEAEVWPNLAGEARKRRIPLALVNARLSKRSEQRFHRFHFLVAPTFRCLDLVCVQEPEDIQRWIALGVPPEKIQHVGSIKYDPADTRVDATGPLKVLRNLGIDGNQPILFGGSTHAGEEMILGEILQKLRKEFPALLLIIAPRHVERAGEINSSLTRLGLNVKLRTAERMESQSQTDCVLIDSTGELQDWYGVATMVFVGKSLTAQGGQNPAEPILASKPVFFGPHMENFAALARALVENQAAIQVKDSDELEENLALLLRDRETGARMVAKANQILLRHSGATGRTARLILGLD